VEDPKEIERVHALGGDFYISKPDDFGHLVEVARRLIRMCGADFEAFSANGLPDHAGLAARLPPAV